MNKLIKQSIAFIIAAFTSIPITYFVSLFVINPVLNSLWLLIYGCRAILTVTDKNGISTSECKNVAPDVVALSVFTLFLLIIFLIIYKFIEGKLR